MLGISAQSNTLAFTFFAALFEKEREREKKSTRSIAKTARFRSCLLSFLSSFFFRLFGAGAAKVV